MMQPESASHDRYFAAANTYHGFVNHFDEVFSDLSHLYLIKGGSGTGKSRFMQEFAVRAENSGYHPLRFYCSFDPTSLDGVLIPERKIGILDATAPHTKEPKYPGIYDEILNLGAFWDTKRLFEKRAHILHCMHQKNSLFTQAYRLLAAAGRAAEEAEALTAEAVLPQKIAACAQRFFKQEKPHGAPGKLLLRQTDGIGMNGFVHFPSLEQRGQTHIALKDAHEIAHLYLQQFCKEAQRVGHTAEVSFSALDPTQLRRVLLSDCDLCLTPEADAIAPMRVLNTDRFLDHSLYATHRPRIRFCKKVRDELISEAITVFSEIKTLHFAIEDDYRDAMDFPAKEAYSAAFLDTVFPDTAKSH